VFQKRDKGNPRGKKMAEQRRKRAIPAPKEKAAKLGILSITLLIVMKVVAGILTGSIGIIADAVHSVIDLTGSVVGLIGIRISGKPPDKRHAFGHGKAEDIAGAVIAGLIFVAAAAIVYEAARRLAAGGRVELVTVGIYVTAAAIVVNVAISWYVSRVGRSTESVALKAIARDMLADVLSSCAVLIGLVLVRLTGRNIFDPIVSLLVAALIARTAFLTIKEAFGGLMDTRLPEAEEETIKSCIMEHGSQVVGFHKLRTRKVGSQRYIELHLVMPKDASVDAAHKVCDHLEEDIGARLREASISIHIEPCTTGCEFCSVSCTLRWRGRQSSAPDVFNE
jgi:cation diffusion facilitator family transporter